MNLAFYGLLDEIYLPTYLRYTTFKCAYFTIWIFISEGIPPIHIQFR